MTRAKLTTTKAPRFPIEAGKIYPLDLFKSGTGFGFAAMRTMRRQGLRVRYFGGRAFVMGDDFLAYVDSIDERKTEVCEDESSERTQTGPRVAWPPENRLPSRDA